MFMFHVRIEPWAPCLCVARVVAEQFITKLLVVCRSCVPQASARASHWPCRRLGRALVFHRGRPPLPRQGRRVGVAAASVLQGGPSGAPRYYPSGRVPGGAQGRASPRQSRASRRRASRQDNSSWAISRSHCRESWILGGQLCCDVCRRAGRLGSNGVSALRCRFARLATASLSARIALELRRPSGRCGPWASRIGTPSRAI